MTYALPPERHTRQRMHRHQVHGPGDDDYDARQDWGSHEAANLRRASHRPSPSMPVIADPHTPCWLCEPGYVCVFHRDSVNV